MGDDFSEGPHPGKPVHEVCISDFYLAKYEVTVADFRDFVKATAYLTDAEKDGGCLSWMGTGWRKYEGVVWKRPGFSQTARHPVVCISWQDASAYILWKREQTGLHYRLPTEAEWEYAARSGGKYVKGPGDDRELKHYAWYRDNAEGKTHAVGQKKANGLGLHDMSGNVWEWVQDPYDKDYYAHSPRNNPQGPATGKGRVMRGGSWYNPPQGLRATHRNWTHAFKRYTSLGFRLALTK